MTSAIVVGSGFCGLLAAKALSRYYDKVTIIEKDPESATGSLSPREGVPQGPHAHLLMPLGLTAVKKLFPNYTEALIEKGAREVDLFNDVLHQDRGHFRPRFKSNRKVMLMSRLLAEETLRFLLKENPKIEFRYHCIAKGLLANFNENQITGARLHDLTKNEDFNLYADLVVDASGARTNFPEWLEALGYEPPPKTTVKIDYIQMSRIYRLPKEFQPDWKYNMCRTTGLRKGAYTMRLEDDSEGAQWLVGVVSHFGEPITYSEEGFLKFAETILSPDLFIALTKATPLSPLKQFVVPAARQYYYSRMKRLPSGFIAMGDAICIWPPHTGLGMVAAAEAAVILDLILSEQNKRSVIDWNRDFFKKAEKMVNRYWDMHVTEDIIPLQNPNKSLIGRFKNWYKARLLDLCLQEAAAWKAMLPIQFSEKPAKARYQPKLFWRVMFSKLKVR